MSQWNNKWNPCVTHYITNNLTRRIGPKIQKNNGEDIIRAQAAVKDEK